MNCLDRTRLQALAGGAVDELGSAHVQGCERCTEALASVRAEEGLLGELRSVLAAKDAGPDAPDQRLPDGFTEVAPLGAGGQGEVFEAVQVSTGRRVAVKLLMRGSTATKSQRARFLRETRLTASLTHPGLVTVYDAGETREGVPYIAMELVQGTRWDAWCDGKVAELGPGAEARILASFLELCDAVAHAHERGILHRDLKPSNVLVDRAGHPHVLDLGLARSLASESDSHSSFRTQTGEFLGSLAWMSPEGLAGREEPGFCADTYALALMLHRGLSGRHAYRMPSSFAAVFVGVKTLPEALEGPFAAQPALDAALRTVLTRALSRQPEERYPTAAALAADVRAAREGRLRGTRKVPARRAPLLAALGLVAVLALTLGLRGLVTTGVSRSVEARRLFDLTREDPVEALRRLPAFAQRFEHERSEDGLDLVRLTAASVYRAHPLLEETRLPPAESMQGEEPRHWDHVSCAPSGDRLAVSGTRSTEHMLLDARGPDHARTLPLPENARSLGIQWTFDGGGCLVTIYGQETADNRLVLYSVDDELKATEVQRWTDYFYALPGRASPVAAIFSRDRDRLAMVRLGEREPYFEQTFEPKTTYALDAADEHLLVIEPTGKTTIFEVGREADGPLHAHELSREREGEILTSYSGFEADLWPWKSGAGLRVLHGTSGVQSSDIVFSPGLIVHPLGHRRLIAWAAPKLTEVALDGKSTPPGVIRVRPRSLPHATESFDVQNRGRALVALGADGVLTRLDMGLGFFPRAMDPERSSTDTVHDVEHTTGHWVWSQGRRIARGGVDAWEDFELDETFGVPDTIVPADGPLIYFSTYLESGRASVGSLDLESKRVVPARGDHSASVSALALSASGDWLVSAGTGSDVLLHPVGGGSFLADPTRLQVPGYGARVSEIASHPEQDLFALAPVDGPLAWLRPDAAQFELSKTTVESRCCTVHPTEDKLVLGQNDGRVSVWEWGADGPEDDFPAAVVDDQFSQVYGLAFTPDGRFLAVAAERTLVVLEWSTKQVLFRSSNLDDSGDHGGPIYAVAFHPSRPVLMSAAENGELFEWDFAALDAWVDGLPRDP